MNKETHSTSSGQARQCQNCKKEFTIEPDDFAFYEKMKVLSPTWCPDCRIMRRMLFRNERSLYKRKCDSCKKDMLSMYSLDRPYVVYCNECYSSDTWNPTSYGKEYDFSRPFFEQLDELMRVVPRRNLYQDFATDSGYTNFAVYMNSSYLTFGGHHYDNCLYCAQNFNLKNCIDVDFSSNSEFCFDSLHLRKCSRVRHGYYSEDCVDSWLIYGCRNCTNCFGCTNLRNKSYCIFNEQLTRETYEAKMQEMKPSSPKNIEKYKAEFFTHTLQFPRKFASVRNITNSTGDDLENVRNCKYCFAATEDENIHYSFFVPTGAKDCWDVEHTGLGATENYELHSSFGCNRICFSNRVYYSHDAQYSDDCYNCENIFGCASLRKKNYCILNKQYSKEEYEVLLPKVIKHAEEMPITDASGRVWKYGEFFPIGIMPFGYNETCAQEYFPLSKEQILERGYLYKEEEQKDYKPTMTVDMLPSVQDADEKVLKEIIKCSHEGACRHKCATAFRLVGDELTLLKALGVPLPTLCPNCRHMERLKLLNPLKLWHRKCMCDKKGHLHGSTNCQNEFETPYAPERPEIIYCEQCYNAEVA